MEIKKDHKTPAEILKAFKSWASGRSGFTTTELVEIFSRIYNLTAAEIKTLEAELKKEGEKKKEDEEKKKKETTPKKDTKEKEPLIISRTPYPKWWKDSKAWLISIDGPTTQRVINQTPGYRTYVATIVLTVDGETDITFGLGVFGPSGSMDLGGTDEPRGMVIAMGDSPLPCGGGGFSISSSGAGVHVGGFIVYYYEKET